MTILYWIIAIFVLIVLWVIYAYNRFITLRFRAQEALSDIDVQLKRRFNLIPNLVETVKGYMRYEEKVLTGVTEARARVALAGGTPIEREGAENALSNTLKTLFAVAENYPDLKANANFLDLQRELADTENKIQASRRFFNTTVRDLNTKINSFPSNLIASIFGFGEEKFFEVDSAQEREAVSVKF
ncbi:MAG: LemA family protein [Candidatus Niyogibacteria bacterium]|nr:MAG: LemA family protein [Candidatus Niyogibacteria bacterium]